MKTLTAKTLAAPPLKQAHPGRSSSSSQRQQKAPKQSSSHTQRPHPQRDQLAVEHTEHLLQVEAFLVSAMNHVLRMGIEGPLYWPALVLRPDGSRVQAPEAVVDRAADLIEGLYLAFDAELRSALGLSATAERKAYRLVARREKDSSDAAMNRPHPDLSVPLTRDVATAGAPPSHSIPPADAG
jgi:hypothetical protein